MKLSEALWGSYVRQIEEEGGGALLLRVPVVEDEKRGDRACPWDHQEKDWACLWGLLHQGYSRGKMTPAFCTYQFEAQQRG